MFFRSRNAKELQPLVGKQEKRRSFQHQPNVASIIVEEEERIRRFWKEFFDERGMKLYLYDSEVKFVEVHKIISFPVQFYFDQDIGQMRGVGIRLAKLVKDLPCRASTSLITNYSSEDFSEELQDGVLDSVSPKYPLEIFGVNFLRARMRQEREEVGAEALVAEYAGKILQAIDPLVGSSFSVHSRTSNVHQEQDPFVRKGS